MLSGHELLHRHHGDSTLAETESELLVLAESEVPQGVVTTDHNLHHAAVISLHAKMTAPNAPMTVDEIGTSMIEDAREVRPIVTASVTGMTVELIGTEETTERTVKNEPTAKTEKVCSKQNSTQKWKEFEADTRISDRFSGPCSRRARHCGIVYAQHHTCPLEGISHQSHTV